MRHVGEARASWHKPESISDETIREHRRQESIPLLDIDHNKTLFHLHMISDDVICPLHCRCGVRRCY